MPEVKSKKSTKAPAAEKRAAADKSLEERIAARKTKSSEKAEAAPFEPNVESQDLIKKIEASNDKLGVTKPVVEKAEKPKRVAVRKPKAEAAAPTGVGDIVQKIEARVEAKLTKAHNAVLKAQAAEHKAELKKLKATLNETMKAVGATFNTELKVKVTEAEKKAYAAGVKAGEKAATKSITAALKGR
jgi:hypothetical protein